MLMNPGTSEAKGLGAGDLKSYAQLSCITQQKTEAQVVLCFRDIILTTPHESSVLKS